MAVRSCLPSEQVYMLRVQQLVSFGHVPRNAVLKLSQGLVQYQVLVIYRFHSRGHLDHGCNGAGQTSVEMVAIIICKLFPLCSRCS